MRFTGRWPTVTKQRFAFFLVRVRSERGPPMIFFIKVFRRRPCGYKKRMPDQNARPRECQTGRECQTVWHSLLNCLFENARRSGILRSGILCGLAFFLSVSRSDLFASSQIFFSPKRQQTHRLSMQVPLMSHANSRALLGKFVFSYVATLDVGFLRFVHCSSL